MCLPPLLTIFCFYKVHMISVLNCAHLCMKCSLSISNFLKISLVFPLFFFFFQTFLSASDPHHGRKVCCVSFRSPKQKASISFLFSELPECVRPTGGSLSTTLVIHRLRIAENSAGHPGLPLPPWWCLQLPAAEATCII